MRIEWPELRFPPINLWNVPKRNDMSKTDDSGLYQVEDGWIETYTGERFYFGNPKPEMIHIMDVAHALSLLCRYNGHTAKFYSVAEHSVLIAKYLFENGWGAEVALTGLLHDVAEAYIGDMPRPIKVTMPAFKELEQKIERAAAPRFGMIYPFPSIIKELDSRILVDEREQVMNESDNAWGTDTLKPLGVEIGNLPPATARRLFLDTFEELADITGLKFQP